MMRVVSSLQDAIELREWAAHQPYITMDTETTGTDFYVPSFAVRTVQFGSRDAAWIVPLHGWVGAVQEVIDIVPTVVVHNAGFDVPALATHQITVPWRKIDDTLIAMRLAEPHLPAGLKEAASRLVSADAAKGQADLKTVMRSQGWTWETIPLDFPAFAFYAALDVVLTARLYETPTCRSGLLSPLYRTEMDVQAICATMERNGMRIDVPFCREEMQALSEEAKHLTDYYATMGLRLGSNTELARWLMSEGVKLTRTTEGGAASVTRDALLEARLDAPTAAVKVIDDALRLRQIQKLANTYYQNFVELSRDGLLHPNINTLAARTGRMSIRAPALQTLPRGDDDPDASRVRQAVIPRHAGDVLLTCDYSQIELRLIASLSEDPALIDAFQRADQTGSDFFTESMRAVYNDPSLPKSDPRRTGVKTLWYASGYGAGVKKMAATAKMPVHEMREIADAVFKQYPGAKALMKACQDEARENDNWITTPKGRRIWIDPEVGYKAMNGKIQAAAGDVFKQAMVELGHAGLEEYMVIPVHDEIVFSVPPDIVGDIRPIIRDVMTCMDYAVPLPADPSEPAKTWGDVEK